MKIRDPNVLKIVEAQNFIYAHSYFYVVRDLNE